MQAGKNTAPAGSSHFVRRILKYAYRHLNFALKNNQKLQNDKYKDMP